MRNGKPCTGSELLVPEDHIVCGEAAKWDSTIMQAGQEAEQTTEIESQPVEKATEPQPIAAQEMPEPQQTESKETNVLYVVLNDQPLKLPITTQHPVYHLMDLLEHTEIDFQNLTQEVCLEINGQEASFQQQLRFGDHVHIYEKPRQENFERL